MKVRTILNKEQKEQFLNDNWKLKTLNFKWSRSGVCRIYDKRGDKTGFYAGGYGYDKKGTALGNLINTHFADEIKKLDSSKYYGLTHYNSKSKERKFQKHSSNNTRSYVDGGCGFDCMRTILEKIGFNMVFVQETNDSITYILTA